MEERETGENGFVNKEEFVKLYKFINENSVILNKITTVNNEEVLLAFNSAVNDLVEENDEVVADKNLTFLFYVLRNSIILNITDEVKEKLQPLSNLALSIEMVDGLLALMQKNHCLISMLKQTISDEEFNSFSQTVKVSKDNKETFLLDTFKAEKTILSYHLIRNKVVKIVLDQLGKFLVCTPSILNYEKSTILINNVLKLQWNQQIIACESMNFDLPFPPGFQTFLAMSQEKQTSSPETDRKEALLEMFDKNYKSNQSSRKKSKPVSLPSYYKSTKIHVCNICDYGTKKLSNIKNHLRGKHRNFVLPPGENGFTTQNESGEILNYIPRKRRKNKNSAGGAASEPEDISDIMANMIRYHQCNFCTYSSEKMSNIKSHVRSVHKDFCMTERDFGFQTLFRPEEEEGKERVIGYPPESEMIGIDYDDYTNQLEMENGQSISEDDDEPAVQDFLECKINIEEDEEIDTDATNVPQLSLIQGERARERERRSWRAKKIRTQMCDSCDYSTRKMSNIKMHVKNVHKNVERSPDDRGFTTVFVDQDVEMM